MIELLVCMALLQIKHLVVDWCWQPPYEWMNKGFYGHWGGIRHSLKNAVGTGLCFVPFADPITVAAVTVMDFVAHYHIDYGKVNINKAMGWGPLTHDQFWRLTGADQAAHQLCYVLWLTFVFVL